MAYEDSWRQIYNFTLKVLCCQTCVYGVGFNWHKLKSKQLTLVGIPLQPVETGISLGRSIPSQGNGAQCPCVFYHQGPSACNSEACLSLTAQVSHWNNYGSVFPKPYGSILPLLFSHPSICKPQSCCDGLLLWETIAASVSIFFHPFPSLWLLSGPNKMHAHSLTSWSTCPEVCFHQH